MACVVYVNISSHTALALTQPTLAVKKYCCSRWLPALKKLGLQMVPRIGTKTTSVKILLPAKSWKIGPISPESITEASCLQAVSSELQSTEESFCQVSRLFYRRDGGRHGQPAELWRYAAF